MCFRPSCCVVLSSICAVGLLVGTVSNCFGQVFHENVKLLAEDGVGGDFLGCAVAIEDGVVAVGAYNDDANGYLSGSAYLFDALTGEQLFKLLPSDGGDEEKFGCALAIDGDVVAVGAHQNGYYGSGFGAVYLYDKLTGAELDKMVPMDGSLDSQFGFAIAMADGVLAIGSNLDDDKGIDRGSAYLFDVRTGEQLWKLQASDGGSFDEFGGAVALADGLVAVGAHWEDASGKNSGSVYVFDVVTGEELLKLVPDDGAEGDDFGIAVAMDGGVVAVGARLDDDNGDRSGSAYLFDAATGAQIAKLLPADGAAYDFFGWSIAIADGVVAVGAYADDAPSGDSGSTYLFDALTGAEIGKLLPSDAGGNDRFGYAVAMDGDEVVVGSYWDDDNGVDAGAAYVFDVNCLDLTIENLVGGERATFTVSGGPPGVKGLTVYGLRRGATVFDSYGGYCATFGINKVSKTKVIGGFSRRFDDAGEITITVRIPVEYSGLRVLVQSAVRGTCPDECMSNVVEAVVG